MFWASQTLSVAGDSLALLAVPLLVLRATGSVEQMGLLTAATGTASVLAGVFAGALVDRVDRRRLLIACDLARLVLYAAVPLAWWLAPQVWLLYVALPLGAAVGMLFRVGYVAVVPALVPADRITEANGHLSAGYAVAAVTGPLLAGLLSGWFGPTTAIAVDAATFGVSALCLATVRFRAAAPPERQGPWHELVAGVRFLWAQPVLRALTILLSAFIFFTHGLPTLLVYRLKEDLGQTDAAAGAVLAAAGLGTVLGAVLVAPVRRRLGFGRTWMGATVACGLAVAAFGLVEPVAAVAALAGGYLCAVAVAGISSMSLRQEVTPDHLLGRVTSAFWATHYSLGPLGAASLTWAAGRHGVTAVCLVAGAGCVAVALSGLATPIRSS